MRIWIKALRESLSSRLFIILAVLTGLYTLAGYILAGLYNWPVDLDSTLYGNVMQFGVMWFVLGLVAWRSFYIMIAVRPDHLTRTILDDLAKNYLTPERLMNGLPVIALFVIMFSVFTSFKSMIPEIEPFWLDPALSHLDRVLFFGADPWRILFPVLGSATLTTALSFIYKTWFMAKICILFWQAFSTRRPALREHFFVAYMLVWIVNGTILATLLSSAGPCFYGHVVPGPNPYAPLMAFLHHSDKIFPVWDLFEQNYLWTAYKDQAITMFSGISAMPSLHISLSFLFVLLFWNLGRGVRVFFTVYLLLMMLASIHLGWHYAVDGFAAILTTFIVWHASGFALRHASKLSATAPGRAGIPESSG